MRTKILIIIPMLLIPLMFVNFLSVKDEAIAVTSDINQSVSLNSELSKSIDMTIAKETKYINVLDILNEEGTAMLDTKGALIVIAYTIIALVIVSSVILYTHKSKDINPFKIMLIGGMLMALSPLVLNAVTASKEDNSGVIVETGGSKVLCQKTTSVNHIKYNN